jgi:hypothetical protein
MCAHQALASASGLFAFSGKHQSHAWLPNAGFHSLVGRIFAAALQGHFNTRGFADVHDVGREKLFLTQFSRDHLE